jgi:Mediator complex subunit 25 von Willebrand factor type A
MHVGDCCCNLIILTNTVERWFLQANCSLYTLVTYYGSDHAPGHLSACQQPMTSTHLFSQSLDRIEYVLRIHCTSLYFGNYILSTEQAMMPELSVSLKLELAELGHVIFIEHVEKWISGIIMIAIIISKKCLEQLLFVRNIPLV